MRNTQTMRYRGIGSLPAVADFPPIPRGHRMHNIPHRDLHVLSGVLDGVNVGDDWIQ